MREYKVQVHLNTEVSKVEAKDGKVTGVLSDGEKKLFRQMPYLWQPEGFLIKRQVLPETVTVSQKNSDIK